MNVTCWFLVSDEKESFPFYFLLDAKNITIVQDRR
jgi:hypothetical protein